MIYYISFVCGSVLMSFLSYCAGRALQAKETESVMKRLLEVNDRLISTNNTLTEIDSIYILYIIDTLADHLYRTNGQLETEQQAVIDSIKSLYRASVVH